VSVSIDHAWDFTLVLIYLEVIKTAIRVIM
jgi:hypothetical protein